MSNEYYIAFSAMAAVVVTLFTILIKQFIEQAKNDRARTADEVARTATVTEALVNNTTALREIKELHKEQYDRLFNQIDKLQQ